MLKNQNWLLQQLGITQWALRRPEALRGEIVINLPEHIRLLLIAEEPLMLDHPLVLDVARCMALTPTQIYGLLPTQAIMLPDDICCHCWWVGLKPLRNFQGISFHTPTLAIFSEDANAKRKLWHIISNYEYKCFAK